MRLISLTQVTLAGCLVLPLAGLVRVATITAGLSRFGAIRGATTAGTWRRRHAFRLVAAAGEATDLAAGSGRTL